VLKVLNGKGGWARKKNGGAFVALVDSQHDAQQRCCPSSSFNESLLRQPHASGDWNTDRTAGYGRQ
jgi:hypothetical protein